MGQNVSLPSKRHAGLLVENVQGEMLVYDLEHAQANCLNQTAALVWEYADGETSVAQIAARVSAELGAPVNEQVVWYALDQLQRKNLLQNPVNLPAPYATLSRRNFMKRVAMVGALVAIPAIVSLTAPTPTEAATCLAAGQVCASDAQCCSTICLVVCA